jgi:hypothetical protein
VQSDQQGGRHAVWPRSQWFLSETEEADFKYVDHRLDEDPASGRQAAVTAFADQHRLMLCHSRTLREDDPTLCAPPRASVILDQEPTCHRGAVDTVVELVPDRALAATQAWIAHRQLAHRAETSMLLHDPIGCA